MKEAKKKEDFFTRYLGEVYNISNMLKQEGCSSAECRYREIVATIMLVIRDDLHAIRNGLFFFGGAFLGLLLASFF